MLQGAEQLVNPSAAAGRLFLFGLLSADNSNHSPIEGEKGGTNLILVRQSSQEILFLALRPCHFRIFVLDLPKQIRFVTGKPREKLGMFLANARRISDICCFRSCWEVMMTMAILNPFRPLLKDECWPIPCSRILLGSLS